jgi:hypothetical protein
MPTSIINIVAAGENELIVADPGQIISLRGIVLTVSGETTITFKSGTNPLSGPLHFHDGGGIALDRRSSGTLSWFDTAPGESLVLSQSSPVSIGGWIDYAKNYSENPQ